uniref:Uncharacterized protein n=1 Tax=Agarophyton chilense TaxID=2510777 RepID=O49040_AGACH|nr:ORF3 [Agarophyton chilense]
MKSNNSSPNDNSTSSKKNRLFLYFLLYSLMNKMGSVVKKTYSIYSIDSNLCGNCVILNVLFNICICSYRY